MSDTLAVLQAALTGRYRLERPVGQGGMGVVYLAQDLKHDREVAIKVLRPGVAALLGRERFLREIGIAAQLSHPHIVPLHDSGEADGQLYYVMPYVAGETLRERLDREGRLPVAEALEITRQVATALGYAHGRGVIHRDIKPSNILLSGGFALVADFGLARALARASDVSEISSIGLAIGTPRYMSPEQAVGSPNVDGRSDLYSLGCVLHEMLTGSSPSEVEPVPPGVSGSTRLTGLRPEVPVEVARAVTRCLARNPDERYATVAEFLTGLGEPAAPAVTRRRILTAVVLGLATAGAVWAVVQIAGTRTRGAAGLELDTTRYAVLPFERVAGAPAFQADVPVRAALGRWTGISVVGGMEGGEALRTAGAAPLDRENASRIAQRLGAGRFVRGQVVPFGDSVQIEAVVYDTRTRTLLVEKSVRLPVGLAGADARMPSLVDSLLFQGAMPVEHFEAPPGTSSVPAMWEFIKGRQAVANWDLPVADSSFGRALSIDATFARAALWLAQVRMWQNQPAATWRSAAAQAVSGSARLGLRDTALAGVVAAMNSREYGIACRRWLALTGRWPDEFPVWYGAATCLSRDTGVERDPRSPTGWRFRSSYHQAQRIWRKAFTLLPAIYRDYRTAGAGGARWLLWTMPNRGRLGIAVLPDTGLFMSYPTWEGDSLSFRPQPMGDFASGRAVRTAATAEAVTRQRLAFYDLVTEWSSANPPSLEAREAVALALWSLGNPAAIDSVRATRALARAPRDRVRLGVFEALMRTLHGIDNPNEVRAARGIADSMLQLDSVAPDIDPLDLATLAALTGRADRLAQLVRRAGPRDVPTLPPGLTGDALALLALAALGGPVDSLVVLERRVADGIAMSVGADGRMAARAEWLGRPLAIVALEISLPSLAQLAGTGDYMIDALAANASRDTAAARRVLERAAASRRGTQPSDLTFEALLPEAQLLNAMGDRSSAIARLDPTLADLPRFSLQLMSHPVGAGLFVRAMAFRADLAGAQGDSATARKWARAVGILWSSADPFLRPLIERMQRLTGSEIH